MTIPSSPRKAGPLLGTGAQTAWPFAFKVFAATDVAVTIADSDGVETLLVLNTDYSVALNANQETSPGGTITYPISGSALPTGSVLSVTGDIEYEQAYDIPTGGNFSPTALENELDRIVMQVQQLKEEIDRSAKLPVTNIEDANSLVADLVRLADSADNIDTVVANLADIITVADDLNEAVSEINTVAVAITNVNNVGNNIANVNTVAGISANVTTVAGISANVTTVAGISTAVSGVAAISAAVSAVNSNATNINAVNANKTNIDTVAGIDGDVTTVAGISADVVAVENIAANITTVAGIAANVTTVAGISSNVTTVAGINADVTSVAGNAANINAVSANATNINAVNANATNIDSVAAVTADVSTVAANISAVNTAANNIAAIIAAPSEAASAAASAAAAAASAASGMYSTVQDKSADYTVVSSDAGDLIRIDSTGGARTITLPAISTQADGFKVAIAKWSGDASAITIVRSSADLINGSVNYVLDAQYKSATFVADAETSTWFAAGTGGGGTNILVDSFDGTGSQTAFTLSGDPGSENNTQVFISGVYQEKDQYAVSGTTLTFSAAPPAGTSNIEIVWSIPLAIGTPSDGTVSTTKLADLAVTNAKMAEGAVGTTKLADLAVTNAKMAAGAAVANIGFTPQSALGFTAANKAGDTFTGPVVATALSDAGGDVRSIPQAAKTAAYVLTAADNGKHISITTGGVTVPTAVFSVGQVVTIFNNSASAQTITQGASTTLYNGSDGASGSRTLGARGIATILCVAANTFVITGAGLT